MKNTRKNKSAATIEDAELGAAQAVEDAGSDYASAMKAEGEKYKTASNNMVAQLCLLTRGAGMKLVTVSRNMGVTAPTVQNYKKKGTATLANVIRWADMVGYDLSLVKREVDGDKPGEEPIAALPWDDEDEEGVYVPYGFIVPRALDVESGVEQGGASG